MSRLLIAQTFIKRLKNFPNQEQKIIRDAVMQLHLDTLGGEPPRPGLRWHALQSPHLYSVSPNMDLRVIVYHADQDYAILYADHHDAAYDWASHRRLEVHPYTGAMQLIELQERTEVVTHIQETEHERPFANYDASYLLQLGIPEGYLQAVLHATTTNAHELLEILPEEVAERLLGLLAGELVLPPEAQSPATDPFTHPDAQGLFMVAQDERELEAALQGEWQDWMLFLHPSQSNLVTRNFRGPARITGGAGTGKTVVALHRAARLAAEGQRVLLTTYSRTLVDYLSTLLDGMKLGEARERITVMTVHGLAHQLSAELGLPARSAEDDSDVLGIRLENVARAQGSKLNADFLLSEWRGVIEAQGLQSWEEYREAQRIGRGTPLGARGRQEVWNIIEAFQASLAAEGKFTWRTMCDALTEKLLAERVGATRASKPPRFDQVIADEAQDLGPSELRFLLALAGGLSGRILLSLDEGQRIYQRAFAFKPLGLNFQGRSARLKLNYRTSRQILELADALLPDSIRDADGDAERRLSLSRFHGPPPEVRQFNDLDTELQALDEWIGQRLAGGLKPSEIAVFTRHDPAAIAQKLTEISGHTFTVLGSADSETSSNGINVLTMHRAKGLEYRAVALPGLTAQVLPSQRRLQQLSDPSDQEDFIAQERHLLYVAATRARDWLLLSYHAEPSPFLSGLSLT